MHFGSLRTNPFSTVCHYLENFIFDEAPQFLIFDLYIYVSTHSATLHVSTHSATLM